MKIYIYKKNIRLLAIFFSCKTLFSCTNPSYFLGTCGQQNIHTSYLSDIKNNRNNKDKHTLLQIIAEKNLHVQKLLTSNKITINQLEEEELRTMTMNTKIYTKNYKNICKSSYLITSGICIIIAISSGIIYYFHTLHSNLPDSNIPLESGKLTTYFVNNISDKLWTCLRPDGKPALLNMDSPEDVKQRNPNMKLTCIQQPSILTVQELQIWLRTLKFSLN